MKQGRKHYIDFTDEFIWCNYSLFYNKGVRLSMKPTFILFNSIGPNTTHDVADINITKDLLTMTWRTDEEGPPVNISHNELNIIGSAF